MGPILNKAIPEWETAGPRFRNRREAGALLAEKLAAYAHRPDLLVLALPRGGVPVGFEIAEELQAPLDVVIVRKLGTPGQEELAMGAITSGGARVLNDPVIRALGIPNRVIESIAAREQRELDRRDLLYRGGRPVEDVSGHTVILVDDGIATGTTMRVAITALREQNPSRLVVAVPVAPFSTCKEFQEEEKIDEFLCLYSPEMFLAIGQWYEDFSQTSDEEVCNLLLENMLQQAVREQSSAAARSR